MTQFDTSKYETASLQHIRDIFDLEFLFQSLGRIYLHEHATGKLGSV